MASKYKKRHRMKESDERTLIKRITEPRTFDDLLLALKIPSTKAYQDMMNMINEGILINDIINELIWKYLNEKYIASNREKEEFLRAYYRKDDRVPEIHIKQSISQHVMFEEINRKDSNALLSLYKSCMANLHTLQKQRDEVHVQQIRLEVQENNIQLVWGSQVNNSITELTNSLNNESHDGHFVLNIRNAEGTLIDTNDPIATRIIENTMRATSSPRDFFRALTPAATEVVAQSNININRKIPTPPPPPPPLPPKPLHMAEVQAISSIMMFLIETIRANHPEINNTPREEVNWGKLILEARKDKNNKIIIKKLETMPRDINPYDAQYIIEQQKYELKLKNIDYQKAMQQEENQMNLCAKQYEKINSRSIEEALHQKHGNYKSPRMR